MARILITTAGAVPSPTRTGVQVRHVVRALSPRHEIDVLAVRADDQAHVEQRRSGRLLRIPLSGATPADHLRTYQRAVVRQLEADDYAVVHCCDPWSVASALDHRVRFGYAVVFDRSRSSHAEDLIVAGASAVYDDARLLDVDLLLVPTENQRHDLVAGGYAGAVAVSPLGVDVDRFDWDLGPSGGAPAIVYLGTLGPDRGLELLIRAMRDVAAATNAQLRLCGPTVAGFDTVLGRLIAELQLSARVELQPEVDHDQAPALLATASIAVAPSVGTGARWSPRLCPTKVLEYMACRRAVVAPAGSATDAAIDSERDGLLFRPGDPVDLARQLIRLVEDPGLRDQLAFRGYQRVRNEFTAAAARRAVRAAYRQLAAVR